jgi:HD-GYP domain-containing protein (c-di-GMP phosphodiesterase class II)
MKGPATLSKMSLSTFENSSILKKFTIYYILMSILPVGVLYFFFMQVQHSGHVEITDEQFSTIMIWVLAGVILGYIAMRVILKGLIDVTKANKETLQQMLGPDRIKELVGADNDEIAVLARTFSEITSRLEENIKNLETTKKTLHAVLSKVGHGLSSMQNIDTFLDLIIETVTEALAGKIGVLMLLDEEKKHLIVKSVFGADLKNKEVRFKVDEVIFGSVIKSKTPLLIPKMDSDNHGVKDHAHLFDSPMICAPLVLHDHALGVIAVGGRRHRENFQEEEMNLLFNLALQTAVAIENSTLNHSAEQTYFETISALALAVDAKDTYSRGHLDRVAFYSVMIAQQLKLGPEDIKVLRDAARLHDIGKIGVTDMVLLKPGPLNDEEWEMMKKHPEIGEGIIKPIHSLRNLCDIVRHHHEKLDGSGYPDRLKEDEIKPLVRILTVADIFDALTTDRPYRKAFTMEKAIDELRRMKGKLDMIVVEAFVEALANSLK